MCFKTHLYIKSLWFSLHLYKIYYITTCIIIVLIYIQTCIEDISAELYRIHKIMCYINNCIYTKTKNNSIANLVFEGFNMYLFIIDYKTQDSFFEINNINCI